MKVYPLLGLVLCALACLCLYLASPHQRLRGTPWPARPARAAALALALLSWLALAQQLQRLTASYVLLTTAMLVLSLLPYLGALRVLRRRADTESRP